MNILSILAEVISPITNLIDNLHTSTEEQLIQKNKMKSEVLAVQAKAFTQAFELEKQAMQAQASIINAEANGQSWLQRSWRPITMLTFLGLVVFDSFGWLASPLASEAWVLLQIGLGGYVVGRSAEKIVPQIMAKK